MSRPGAHIAEDRGACLRGRANFVTLIMLFGVSAATGQNLVVNPSFENGTSQPSPWVAAGPGLWENFGRSGGHCVSVAGQPDSIRTWSAPLTLETNQAYWVRFWCSASNSLRGFVYGGIDVASRDFTRPSQRWTDYAYIAWIPNAAAPRFQLSSWDGGGPIYFDDAEVLPLKVVHRRAGDYEIGAGESIHGGRYTFATQFGSFGGNYCRAVHRANTTFNTSRWYMNNGSYVTYRHELGGQPFSNANVSFAILNYNNLTNTTLIVEASVDGENWEFAGSLARVTGGSFPLPEAVQPATTLWVRLRSTNATQFALSQYTFGADIPDTTTSVTGQTLHFGKLHPAEVAKVVDIQNTSTGRVATLSIPNLSLMAKSFECRATTTAGATERERVVTANIAAAATNLATLLIPTAGLGDNNVVITVRDAAEDIVLFQQIHRFSVNLLEDDSFGELLPSPGDCPTWTCSGNHKVGRLRGVPLVTNSAVRIAAARNDYEPFQLVLAPNQPLTNVMVSIGHFVSVTNPAILLNSSNVTIERVEYVNITVPDPENLASVLGEHPDPLPPLNAPFLAPAGLNSPLWFTVYVPKEIPGGRYTSSITVRHEGGAFAVPVELRVFDFSLSDVTHTRSMYGVIPQLAWHGLGWETTEAHLQIWELYMQNMARHRVSPIVPYHYASLGYAYHAATESFSYNFNAFDSAMERFLEEYNFNSFRDVTIYTGLPEIPGVPTYNAQRTAILPEYRRLYKKLMPPIMQHFRERGWMGIGMAHWMDEPAASQVQMVHDGMQMIEEAGPDHPRFMGGFNSPEPELFDAVSVWAPHLGFDTQYQHLQPRREAGDGMWYYVCTTPKDPWPNNFIDQPGISPRIRQWYAELLQLEGEIYWGVNYYLGVTNPWTETMSRGANPGGFFNLGNGDGTMVYPPAREKPTNGVLIAGPINSVRYETTREGYEDREYFWLLKRLVARAKTEWGTSHPAVLEGEAALGEAMGMLSWPPIYPYDPFRLEAARTRLAEAIEALDDHIPFVAKEPLSKVVVAGSSERLRVEVVGWPVPSIQWQHAGTNLPGATGPKLSLNNITPEMAGEYRAIGFNAQGAVTSAVGRITLLLTNQPPVIVKHPTSLIRTNMNRAVFGVGASSLTPMRYQWLHEGMPVGGASNVTLVLPTVNIALTGQYAVVASNAFGAVTSAPALLNVQVPADATAPSITSAATNLNVVVGQTVQLSATVSGSVPLSYQWYFNGSNLPSATGSNVLVLTNVQTAHSGTYQLAAANLLGATTNVVASMTVVVVPPSILSAPTNLTIAEGQDAQFQVAAGGTAPLTYQWFFNGTNVIVGAGGSSLWLTNVQPSHVGAYSVRVTNIAGAVTSAPALLQLSGMPNYTTEPPGLLSVRLGNSAALVLAPDNRTRTVLVSSNLLNWDEFHVAEPTAAQLNLPLSATNHPFRFFRLRVEP